MADFVILVTGSRTWRDRKVLWDAMDQAFAEGAVALKGDDDWRVVIRHGACPKGADAMAAEWVRIRKMIWGERLAEDRCPANWGKYGRRAGPIRNGLMVDAGADLALAFLMDCFSPACSPVPHYSHGAGSCASLAAKARIRTRRFTAS